jgi:hypothetical protein
MEAQGRDRRRHGAGPGVPRIILVCVPAVAVLLAVAAGTTAAPLHEHGPMMMVGNDQQYPDLGNAGARNVARARSILRASLGTMHRVDTVAKARRLGYKVGAEGFSRPGFTHLRKRGTRFWGRVLDAGAPQSVMFWCPARGRCTLAVYMFRAPPGDPPSTWGDLLMWHRHANTPTASWMTHMFLVRRVSEAFATCAPMVALQRDRGIRPAPFRAGIKENQPCDGEAPMQGEQPVQTDDHHHMATMP